MNEEVKEIADKIVSLLKFIKTIYMHDNYKLIYLNYFLMGKYGTQIREGTLIVEGVMML